MFKVTHKEELGKTLGFQFERTADGGIFMHQESYVRDVLKRFGMSECRAVSTSADHHVHLCETGAYRVEKGTPFQGGHQTQGVCDTTDDILLKSQLLHVLMLCIVKLLVVCYGCLWTLDLILRLLLVNVHGTRLMLSLNTRLLL